MTQAALAQFESAAESWNPHRAGTGGNRGTAKGSLRRELGQILRIVNDDSVEHYCTPAANLPHVRIPLVQVNITTAPDVTHNVSELVFTTTTMAVMRSSTSKQSLGVFIEEKK